MEAILLLQDSGENPERFNLSPGVDIFDNFKIYMTDCDRKSFVIWKMRDNPNVEEAIFERGMVDKVLTSTVEVLRQWSKENPNFPDGRAGPRR